MTAQRETLTREQIEEFHGLLNGYALLIADYEDWPAKEFQEKLDNIKDICDMAEAYRRSLDQQNAAPRGVAEDILEHEYRKREGLAPINAAGQERTLEQDSQEAYYYAEPAAPSAVEAADIDSLLDWLEGRSSGGRALTRQEASHAVRDLARRLDEALEKCAKAEYHWEIHEQGHSKEYQRAEAAEAKLREQESSNHRIARSDVQIRIYLAIQYYGSVEKLAEATGIHDLQEMVRGSKEWSQELLDHIGVERYTAYNDWGKPSWMK